MRPQSVDGLAADIDRAGIIPESGVTIEVPPLNGLDSLEIADARDIATRLRKVIDALAPAPLLAAKLPIWTVLLTAAMVNTRFVIFSAGLAPHFSYLPFWRRLALGYFNGDVIYLLFLKKSFPNGYVPGKEAYFWGMSLVSWTFWQVSSIAGILLASVVPDNWGLELAGTLALVPLIVSAVINRSMLAALAVAALVAVVAIDLPYRLSLPLAVFTAIAAGSVADLLAERADFKRIRTARAARRSAEQSREP